MRILTRYVLAELLTVFLLTLLGMTTLIFVGQLGQEAVDKGLGLGPLVRIMPYLLPQAMQFAIPGTMLLATTSVYGRMASSNEVVALKSMGISPWKIVTPTLVLATLVSFGAVFVNDIAVSWGRLGVQRVVIESFEEVVHGQLRVHHSYSDGRVQINVRRVDSATRRLISPVVTFALSDGQPARTVSAEWAELESSASGEELIVRMHNLELDGPQEYFDAETVEQTIVLDQFLNPGNGGRSPSTYALSEIVPAVDRQKRKLDNLNGDMAAQATLAMLTGEMEQLATTAWEPRQKEMGSAEYTLNRLYAEPYRRWATGFSCLAFVMVGVPVAVIFRKGEFLASFFMCFAPILIVYYPLLMVSVDKAKGGAIPPISVWIGNLVLAVAGAYLMRRVLRY
ncbi:MAG: LptF/LptG family permease [Planctomycetota bacterium]